MSDLTLAIKANTHHLPEFNNLKVSSATYPKAPRRIQCIPTSLSIKLNDSPPLYKKLGDSTQATKKRKATAIDTELNGKFGKAKCIFNDIQEECLKLEEKIIKLTERNDQLKKSYERVMVEKIHISNEEKEKNLQVQRLQDHLLSQNEKIVELGYKNVEKDDEIKKLLNDYEIYKQISFEAEASQKEKITLLSRENANLREKLEKIEADIETNHAKTDAKDKDIERLKSENRKLNEQKKALDETISQYKKDSLTDLGKIQDLNNKLNREHLHQQKLEDALNQAKEQLFQKEEENNELRRYGEYWKNETNRLRGLWNNKYKKMRIHLNSILDYVSEDIVEDDKMEEETVEEDEIILPSEESDLRSLSSEEQEESEEFDVFDYGRRIETPIDSDLFDEIESYRCSEEEIQLIESYEPTLVDYLPNFDLDEGVPSHPLSHWKSNFDVTQTMKQFLKRLKDRARNPVDPLHKGDPKSSETIMFNLLTNLNIGKCKWDAKTVLYLHVQLSNYTGIDLVKGRFKNLSEPCGYDSFKITMERLFLNVSVTWVRYYFAYFYINRVGIKSIMEDTANFPFLKRSKRRLSTGITNGISFDNFC